MNELSGSLRQKPRVKTCQVKLTSFKDGFRESGELKSLSSFGATVRIARAQKIPKRFSILIPNLLINVGCQVVWSHRSDVGLLFDQKVDAVGATDNMEAAHQMLS